MIIFLDVDGTIINYEAKYPKSASIAISKARKNGHQVFLCTGCSKFEIENRHFDFEVDGMIGGNGNYIEYHNEVIYHNPLTLEQCIHFVDWCKERGLAHRLECNEGIYISDDYVEKSYKARMKYRHGEGKEGEVFEDPSWIHGNMYRDNVNKTAFVLSTYNDYLDAKEEFKDMTVGTWGGKGELALYGDTSPLGISKKSAVEFILNYMHEDKKDTFGFGDSKSDLPLFEAVNIKVAMGNGGIEIKEKADYITDSVDDNGLYNAFKHFNLI